MTYATIADSSQLNNHELNKLVDKMTELLKLQAIQTIDSQVNPEVYKYRPAQLEVGEKEPRKYPSVGSIIADKYKAADDSTKRAIRLDLGRDKNATKAIRRWGIDMRSKQSVFDQIDLHKHFGFINGKTFSNSAMNKMITDFSAAQTADLDVSPEAALTRDLGVIESRYASVLPSDWRTKLLEALERRPLPGLNKALRFRLHEVKCIDETNPEWAGHDEIACGGAAVDDADETYKLEEFFVRGGFDDGERKVYSPPKVLKDFTFHEDNHAPHKFLVTLALAEKDAGGLSKFIDELYQAIEAHLQLILSGLGAAAGAAIGAEIGGSIGTAIAGPLGTIIGVVAGAILGALIGWLISALKDDIFAPQASSAIFATNNDTFAGGSLVSPPMFFHYQDHGGHYRVKFDWQIVR